jgi:ATP-dependent Clp protease ATP-binding subunit ClpB
MNMGNITSKLQEAFQMAQNQVFKFNNHEMDSAHLLMSLTEQKGTQFNKMLQLLGINDISALREDINDIVESFPKVEDMAQTNISRELQRVILSMQEISGKRGDTFLRGELFIPSVLSFDNKISRILNEHGLDVNKLDKVMDEILAEPTESMNQEDMNDILSKYTIDFTQKALDNKLDPVIGRSEEIRRTMQILARRTKNNPVLIGHPGVGKTAVVEGLAQRIIQDEVPESLKGKRVLGLDLVSLVAGAKMRGDFEERLQNVLKAINKENGKIILFIDELHTLVGAGRGDGALEASNMLKPALARGELRCIGATTLDEYKKYVEKDAALESRFQKILVNEPSVNDTVAILRGLKEKYEIHHGVTITDGAIIAAAKLSKRYITDRFLPDKAIDLIDEAAAQIKMEIDSKPDVIDRIERQIFQLNVEITVLDKDSMGKNQIESIKQQLSSLEQERDRLTKIWEKQKSESVSVQELKNDIEKVKEQLKTAKKNSNWEEVGRYEYEVLPKLTRLLERKENAKDIVPASSENEEKLFRKSVTEDEIAQIVSKSTGIQVDKMVQTQKQRLIDMEKHLHKSIVGQNKAVVSVAKTIRRARSGMSDENRPYGSFLFLGPSGVGKTELVKSLAKFLFDSEKNIIRIDMSELMEKHSVSRLIGSPPGYVGYEEGGSLTEAVRRKPYSILLLDEIEKAHPDVFNVLLQVLDEGHLTDGQGNVVDFKNTVIVMTSNLGANKIQDHMNHGNSKFGFVTKDKDTSNFDEDYDSIKSIVMKEVKQNFKPEFINRIDDIVIFEPLNDEHTKEIVKLQLDKLLMRLKDKNISMIFDDYLVEHIAKVGFDPLYGARPLKRVIQNEVESFISDKLLADEVVEGGNYVVCFKDGQLNLKSA